MFRMGYLADLAWLGAVGAARSFRLPKSDRREACADHVPGWRPRRQL